MNDQLTMSAAELENLAADRPLITVEAFNANDFYGNASVLKEYCGLPDGFPLPGILPHGPSMHGKVWDAEIGRAHV